MVAMATTTTSSQPGIKINITESKHQNQQQRGTNACREAYLLHQQSHYLRHMLLLNLRMFAW
jgi:hypothetical protein